MAGSSLIIDSDLVSIQIVAPTSLLAIGCFGITGTACFRHARLGQQKHYIALTTPSSGKRRVFFLYCRLSLPDYTSC
ncbi:hypothetical protein EJ03DRAFT_331746 [Teratosphaeria nubilosa]|uniref:Uncharacterized protein n=1 Tax=Teratosphaeria nubilosa TaxID=161662 RepID=A0A6G1KW54_9PEZI|nr:hypothetical protein EJ03DRAFT_331746 [Teratosphaeria nubilosa]